MSFSSILYYIITFFSVAFFFFIIYVLKIAITQRKIGTGYSKHHNNCFPYSLQKSLLTNRELEFFSVLKPIAEKYHYYIAVKPRIADFIQVNERSNFYYYFNKISAKHVDFLLCDQFFRPIIAIELDDLTHMRGDRIERDNFVNDLYKAVDLNILHLYTYDSESLDKHISHIRSKP